MLRLTPSRKRSPPLYGPARSARGRAAAHARGTVRLTQPLALASRAWLAACALAGSMCLQRAVRTVLGVAPRMAWHAPAQAAPTDGGAELHPEAAVHAQRACIVQPAWSTC